MTAIPGDIWRQVAQFLPRKDLRDMLEVNSSLFHLAMDARYHSVTIQGFNDATVKQLWRLREPIVAPRIRQLHMNVSYSDTNMQSHLCSWQTDSKGNFTLYNASVVNILQEMTNTVMFLTNVTEFSIMWPSYTNGPSERGFSPFLDAAWKAFGPGLRKFALKVDGVNLGPLVRTADTLPALQELEMEIQPNFGDGWVVASRFINQVSPTLRSLSICSHHSLDCSSFFTSPGHIPNLEKLTIYMAFAMWGASELRGLTHFLRKHAAKLRHVHLSLNDDSTGMGLGPHMFINWMEANQFDKTILSDLSTLQINILSQPEAFDLVVGYIRHSQNTLTSLSLFGHFLRRDQVDIILSIFTHRQPLRRLATLRLHVGVLSPELLLMLAKTLPGLHQLTLKALCLAGSDQSMSKRSDTTMEAHEFAHGLRNCDFRSWKLYEIDVETSIKYTEIDSGMTLRSLLAECIPSIRVGE